MSEDQVDVLAQAAAWKLQGHGVALATVVQTWGSSPRPPGSCMAVREDRLFAGSVSGGCVESSVVQAAREVIRTAKPRLLQFGVSDEQALQVGLACGGTVLIYLEPLE